MSWIPPFVVGLSAAIAAEVAVGLLLYVTPGFLRALTLILAVLLGSLALGLWTAPTSDEGLTERLRRRWLLVLFAFAGSSVVAGVWSVRGGLAGAGSTQGLGLALLAALPLYACGALLGGMSAPRLLHVRGPVGSASAAGAALGTVLAGYVLAAVLHPVSIYAFCLVLLSAAAIVHGAVIAAEGERRRLHAVSSPFGPVRVEEWSWGKSRRERVLSENGRVRGVEDAKGEPVRKWERAALEIVSGLAAERLRAGAERGASPVGAEAATWVGEAHAPDPGAPPPAPTGGESGGALPGSSSMHGPGALPGATAIRDPLDPPATPAAVDADRRPLPAPNPSVLILGAGALTLARLIVRREAVDVDAVERNPAVVQAARAHLLAPDDSPRIRVRVEDPVAVSGRCLEGAHLAVVVDSSATRPEDPLGVAGADELHALRRCLSPGGVLMIGGIDRERALGAPLDHLLSEAGPVFPSVAVFGVERSKRAPLVSHAPPSELLLVLSTDAEAPFPGRAGDLGLETVSRRESPLPAPPEPGALP